MEFTSIIQTLSSSGEGILVWIIVIYIIAEKLFGRAMEWYDKRRKYDAEDKAKEMTADEEWVKRVLNSNTSYQDRIVELVRKVQDLSQEIMNERIACNEQREADLDSFNKRLETERGKFEERISNLEKYVELFKKADAYLKSLGHEIDYDNITMVPAIKPPGDSNS